MTRLYLDCSLMNPKTGESKTVKEWAKSHAKALREAAKKSAEVKEGSSPWELQSRAYDVPESKMGKAKMEVDKSEGWSGKKEAKLPAKPQLPSLFGDGWERKKEKKERKMSTEMSKGYFSMNNVTEWAGQFMGTPLYKDALQCLKDQMVCEKEWAALRSKQKGWRELEEMPRSEREQLRKKQGKELEAIQGRKDKVCEKKKTLEGKLVDFKLKEEKARVSKSWKKGMDMVRNKRNNRGRKLDGTGPEGKGPKTGRGLGVCEEETKKSDNPIDDLLKAAVDKAALGSYEVTGEGLKKESGGAPSSVRGAKTGMKMEEVATLATKQKPPSILPSEQKQEKAITGGVGSVGGGLASGSGVPGGGAKPSLMRGKEEECSKAMTSMSMPRVPKSAALRYDMDTHRSATRVLTRANSVFAKNLHTGPLTAEVIEQVEDDADFRTKQPVYKSCSSCGRTYLVKSLSGDCPTCSINKSSTCKGCGRQLVKGHGGYTRCPICG